MPWSSSIPAAVDALYAAVRDTFAASDDLKAVKVLDGPAIGGGHQKQAVIIGYSPEEDGEAVESSAELEGLALNPQREHFTINCAVELLAGSGTVSAARRRAYDIVAAVGQVISADPKLGGTVMRAYIAAAPLRYDPDPQGLLVTVPFAVACDAYTGR